MADTNDFRHLELVFQKGGKKYVPKKMKIPLPSSVNINRANRGQHSGKLYGQAQSIIQLWSEEDKQRILNDLPELSDKKPLLINIPAELLDIDYLRSTFGLELVCEYDDGIVIVATDPNNFNDGLQKILDFANDIKGTGNVAKINDLIVEESKQQRLNRILSDELLSSWDAIIQASDKINIFELSIECQGTIAVGKRPSKKKDESDDHYQNKMARWEERKNKAYDEWDDLCRQRKAELERIITSYGGKVLEIFDFIDDISIQDSFELKVTIPNKCLVDIALNYPFVFEIKQPDDVDSRISNFSESELLNTNYTILPPKDDSATVCVIDSGIQEGHAYIKDAVKQDLSKCFLPSCIDINDQVSEGGHGTRVAGAILYPEGISSLDMPQYRLPCYIANAKVLDEECSMPKSMLPSKVVGEIIQEYAIGHNIRLFNHSISARYPCLTKYMSSWAATIDNASYEKDILLIQAAGNLKTDSNNSFRLGITQHIIAGRLYPNYLLENSCRIPNPAQSMQALTVGAININGYEDDDWTTFGGRGAISSYSCSGLGLWGSIKPEIVEYGGDVLVNKSQVQYKTISSTCPELIRVSPPAYAKDQIGTSFATPKVSYIASQLQQLLPNELALLYKALIVQSARWTSWTDNFSTEEKKDVLRLMGYGLPNSERALTNNENRITYITSGEKYIEAGYVHIFRVKVPQSIRNRSNTIRIDVTLAFSSKPRRTRKGFRGYFATWVDWMSSKFNEDLDAFANRILSTPEETDLPEPEEGSDDKNKSSIPWVIGARDSWGQIKGVSRSRSATQKDWAEMEAYKLPEEFCIAVVGHKGWNTNGEFPAKYALCVSFESVNHDMEIYETFAQVEVPVEAEQEIETEIEVDDE